MIVWQGLGFLAALIPIALGIACQIILDGILGTAWFKNHAWAFGYVLLLAAVCVWFLGKKLNSKPGKILIDPATNQNIEIKQKHTIFWMPMEWFAVVLVIFAAFNLQ